MNSKRIAPAVVDKHSRDASAAIRARKDTIRAALNELRLRVESAAVDGGWGVAGDLGHIEAQLLDLVNR
jgi:hypothetical protein